MIPLNDYIFVRNIPYEPSKVIFIPPEFKKKMKHMQEGEVLLAADKAIAKRGETVVYEKYAGVDLIVDGENVRVLQNHNIICIK